MADAPQCSVGVLVRTNKAVARMIYLLRKLRRAGQRRRGQSADRFAGRRADPVAPAGWPIIRATRWPGFIWPIRRWRRRWSWPTTATIARRRSWPSRTAAAAARTRVTARWSSPGPGGWPSSCDRRDQSRLQQLVELAYEYQPASTLRTDDFVRLVEQRQVADPSSADVRVMTIHQAKGLEFDIVVLPELDGHAHRPARRRW